MDVATARTDRSLLSMNFPITRHYFSTNNYLMGMRKIETEFGCYNIYDIERSICDMLRLESDIEIGIVDKIKINEEQYRHILRYAELLRVKQQL